MFVLERYACLQCVIWLLKMCDRKLNDFAVSMYLSPVDSVCIFVYVCFCVYASGCTHACMCVCARTCLFAGSWCGHVTEPDGLNVF